MNQDTFEFEKLYQIELDRIYKELGYQIVKRIRGKENRYYDVVLVKDNKQAKIEEKALTYYHSDCPIELIQNVWPFDSGWFYDTKADYIHYFYYLQGMFPYILYQVSMSNLKKLMLKNEWKDNVSKYVKPRHSVIHYGYTINLCIKWNFLLDTNCAWVLKKWNRELRNA